jgi:hypothetical protein
VHDHEVAFGDHPLDGDLGVGELLVENPSHVLESVGAVGGLRVVLDVVRPSVTVDDRGVARLEHALEDADGNGLLVFEPALSPGPGA